MWLLLVALCLAQGLGDAVPCTGASHDNPEQFMNIVSAGGVQAFPWGVPEVLPKGPIGLSPCLTLVSAPMGSQGSQIICFHGYHSKEHQVPIDGYFLTVNRIPGPRLPVLLQHGLVLDGSNWVSNFSNNSLGFILADAREQENPLIFLRCRAGYPSCISAGQGPPTYHVHAPWQTVKTGEFKQFDYGEKNKEKYSQTSPPFYRIEDMTVPTALWSGGEDWFTSTLETQCLLLRITNLVHCEHFPDWNH
ncbi:hypothetical protein QYF61_015775 [Mycteria americana]|uniref:Partial AB-hydrolase lipase domain-containing protein n=1 Tax=Mycteria americana TaxID=33587 RepID=A0AAN7RXY2_MYCAM|nr:hypothetical protein QYF61_015775 [Mycteria americana]